MENICIHKYDVALKLWGDLACFTRPEFKVERVTYPVMTPSAARGALEAIFWKPEFRWEIREIWILEPVREIAIMRNELKHRQSMDITSFVVEDRRQPRSSLFLKNPAYQVFADIRLKEGVEHPKKKYIEQFNRRLGRGQCYHQPYLGTRECSAYFSVPRGDEKPVQFDMSIGNMLFDSAYCRSDIKKEMKFIEHHGDITEVVDGFKQSVFFTAKLEAGVMQISWSKYEELYRLEGGHVKGVS